MELAAFTQMIALDRHAWYLGRRGAAKNILHLAEIAASQDFRFWPIDAVEHVAAIFYAASVVRLHQRDPNEARMWANYASGLGHERHHDDATTAGVIAFADTFPAKPKDRLDILSTAQPASSAMQVLLVAHTADAHALAGDERAAMETLDVLEHAVIAARKDGWSKIWAGEVGVGIGLSVRGGVTMRLGRLGDAEQSLRTRLSMTWPGRPGHESRLTLARVLARQGVMDEALDLGTVAAQALLPVSPRAATAVEELRDTLARAGLRTRGLDYALVANPSDQRPSLDR